MTNQPAPTDAPAPVTTGAQLLPWLAGIARRAYAAAQAAGDAAYAAAPEGQKTTAYHQAYVLAARKAGLAPVCHCDFCAATKAVSV